MKQAAAIIRASAGSGKTRFLTQEYLAKLFLWAPSQARKDKESWKNFHRHLGTLFAITFTNKAANEMKERILKILRDFSLKNRGHRLEPQDEQMLAALEKETNRPQKWIIANSAAFLEMILANYSDFNVKTIDSVMSSMISVLSPDLGLPPDFEIAVDATSELDAGIREFLEIMIESQWPVVEHFLLDLLSLGELTTWNIEEELSEHMTKLYLMALRQEIPPSAIAPDQISDELGQRKEQFLKNLEKLQTIMVEEPRAKGKNVHLSGTYIKEPFLGKIRGMFSAQSREAPLDLINGTFFTKKDPEIFLIKKKDDSADFGLRFSQAFTQTRESLASYLWTYSQYRIAYAHLFLSNFLHFWNTGRKTIYVEEFSKTLKNSLDQWGSEALPYLYLKLSEKFWHLFFDEFQDTSELQFKALAPLIDEQFSGQAGSLLLVGDRKQAIYRWRGGNAELMNENILLSEIPSLQHIPIRQEVIHKNWRSDRAIVEFNNIFWHPEAISQTFTLGAIAEAIGQNFADSQQQVHSDRPGYVELVIHRNQPNVEQVEDETEEGDKLLNLVLDIIQKTISQGHHPSDIAILTRKNDDCRRIIGYLAEKGISAVSDESLLLSSSLIIQEIIAFFRFLDFPPDNLNFFTFLSGNVFLTAAKARFPEEIKTFLDSQDELAGHRLTGPSLKDRPLYVRFREMCPESWKTLISPFYQSVGFLPPYDLFQDMTQVFQIHSEKFKGQGIFLLSFGELLHQLEKKHIHSIGSFIAEWDQMVEDHSPHSIDIPADSGRVRVLTIHKSKGLQFPVVVMPLTSRQKTPDSRFFISRGRIHHISRNLTRISPELNAIWQRENTLTIIDELNLLYVAFTRAQHALFIPIVDDRSVSPKNRENPEDHAPGSNEKFSNFAQIILRHPNLGLKPQSAPIVRYWGSFEKKEQPPGSSRVQALSLSPKKMTTASWQSEFLVFRRSQLPAPETEEKMTRGEQIHHLLAEIDSFPDKEAIKPEINKLGSEYGMADAERETLTCFLKADPIFPFFSGQAMAVYREKEMVEIKEGEPMVRRVDRLIEKQEEVIALDFKTGQEKKVEYRQQLQDYLRILATLYPGKRIVGFILYVDRRESEEVGC